MGTELAILLLVGLLRFQLTDTCSAANEDLSSLLKGITRGYEKRFRPVKDWRSPVTVYLDLALHSIIDLQDKEEKVSLQLFFTERWQDENLVWDPPRCDDLTHFTLPAASVWTPDISLSELVGEENTEPASYISVGPAGWLQRVRQLVVVVRCNLAMFKFPFDVQRCNLTFRPNLHAAEDVRLVPESRASMPFHESPTYTSHGQWQLQSLLNYSFSEKLYNRTYSMVAFEVTMARCPTFYVIHLIVPSAFVMLIDVFGFAIPADTGERVSFKITLLFGYTVFLVLVNDLLPPFRDATPVLGIYFVVCMAFLVLSVAQSVLLLALVRPDIQHKAPPLPCLSLRLFPDWKAKWTLRTEDRHANAYLGTRSLHRYLEAAFEKKRGNPEGESRLLGALKDLEAEVREVSGELQDLLRRSEMRRMCQELLGTLDAACFCAYLVLLALFFLALSILWGTDQ
ncbi:5-hydroxytryptamine receptor 3A-like [Polypterus senegalus]|uniref:5-hydroxytryptamine receptor 3A-like n=1 Tax=Polypterus senegalus TaxID=55291 RepID=UPI001962AD13|nr:5-hydroxytryptamine receptor 3A-like [Polypterus senegalus]